MTESTSSMPLVAVTGCTGIQGGSVARYLLETGQFRVRGLTRNTASVTAEQLAKQGVEVVQANLDNLQSLRRAFRGCTGVFAVTNYWEHGGEAETRHGKNMVDSAKAEDVKHFVWSTMEHSGELQVQHFDSKAKVNDYLLSSGLSRTSIYTAGYFENFESHIRPTKQHDPVTGDPFYTLDFNCILPDAKIFAFSGREIGAWVREVFIHPETYLNSDVKLVVEWLSTREMAATASRITKLDVRPRECTMEELEEAQKNGEIYIDLYKMTMYYITHPPESGVRNREETLKMFPKASTWEDYVKHNASAIFGEGHQQPRH